MSYYEKSMKKITIAFVFAAMFGSSSFAQQDVQLTERDLGKNAAPKVDPADAEKVGEPTNL